MAATPERQSFGTANPKPCADCPWRVENLKRKPDPHKFYTLANLRRLWKGLRNGERMTCHPTDPHMAEYEGLEKTADRKTTHECTGATILVQREIMRFQECAEEADAEGKKDGFRRYQKKYPGGLTKIGFAEHVWLALTGVSDMRGGHDPMPVARPNLNQTDVQHPDLVPWEARSATD